MDEKRLRKLAGLTENREVLSETTIEFKPDLRVLVSVEARPLDTSKKQPLAEFSFSSFDLSRHFTPKIPVPIDFKEELKWEDKRVKEMSKKIKPLVKKFISDAEKLLKTVD